MGEKQSKGAAPGLAGSPQESNSNGAEDPISESSADGKTEEPMPSESEILAKLVAHLGVAKDRRMPLSEIRAGLPPSLRTVAQDTQAIRTWLSRFEGLFELAGEPGQEQVVLVLGGGAAPKMSSPPPAPPPPPATAVPAAPTFQLAVPADAPEAAQGGGNPILTGTDFGDDEIISACTVQLRGLPFRATNGDIKAFLGDHVNYLATKDNSIRLLLNRDGRPSGFARVQFATPEATKLARDQLHKQAMGDRYIEVLACSDRAGKARNRRAVVGEEPVAPDSVGPESPLDSATEAVERERVLQECRDHMRMPGRNQLLLSMLGIALSPQARNYLRRLNLGLKHFLARFPGEFRVEGPKGCEQVLWMPNGVAEGYQSMMPQMDPGMMAHHMSMMAAAASWGAADPEASLEQWRNAAAPVEQLLASPTPMKPQNMNLLATPSDWGTPGGGGGGSAAAAAASTASAEKEAATAAAAATTAAGPDLDFSNPFANPWAAAAGFPAWPHPWCGPGGWPPHDGSQMDGSKGKAGAASKKYSAKADTPAARSHAHLHPQSHPFAHKPPGAEKTTHSSGSAEAEGPNSNVAAVRLRGLPFSMSVQDVLAFFAQYDVADRIADGPQAAQLLPKANGRPSGQARVQMRNRGDAEVAQQALNHQWIGGRYIEVFVYGDEPEHGGNDFGGPASAADPASAWRAGAAGAPPAPFPGFPGFPGAFPGSFPPTNPLLGAPPWAMMSNVAQPDAGAPVPGDTNLDNLFSFLYNGDAAATDAAPAADFVTESSAPRNAVQV